MAKTSKCKCGPHDPVGAMTIYASDFLDTVTKKLVEGPTLYRCSGCGASWRVDPDGSSHEVEGEPK